MNIDKFGRYNISKNNQKHDSSVHEIEKLKNVVISLKSEIVSARHEIENQNIENVHEIEKLKREIESIKRDVNVILEKFFLKK